MSTSSKMHWLAIVAIAFAVFLVALDRIPVPTVDGAVRASMARNIVKNHQLWPITYDGKIFTDHPPLYLWFTAMSYKLFGINDFAVNLVPRFFAFLTVIVTALIALEAGLGQGAALATALILCLTRDFVLSSVRGYIEPVLEFWIYLGFCFALRQKRTHAPWAAAASAVSVWLAAYSKGPVALWPLLFFFVALLWNGQTKLRRLRIAGAYVGAFAACTVLWSAWVTARGDWPYWRGYLFGQVLSSALEGRGGAQSLEPFFFAKILAKYYWPWLPLLVWAIGRSVRDLLSLDFSTRKSYSWIFLIMALGFIGGFSLMKWKFWYYIAPAYPALALFIASSFYGCFARIAESELTARRIFWAAAGWSILASIAPIELHRERVPEVMAFRETIVNSNVTGPVWFTHDPMDHNMIGTSGEWYFNRSVVKVVDRVEHDRDGNPTGVSESDWIRNKLNAPAWIITGRDFFQTCAERWCQDSILIQSAGKSSLVYYQDAKDLE